MIFGWKTDLAKKVVETVIINFAVLAVKEIFIEGSKFIREKFKSEEESEDEAESENDKSKSEDEDPELEEEADDGIEDG